MGTTEHRAQAPVVAAFAPTSGAREPVEFALAASRLTGALLVIAVVAESGSLRTLFDTHEIDKLPAGVREPVRHLELDLERRGVQADIRFFADSTPARGLARAIDEHDPELIVLGSTHRGSRGKALLGT